MNSFELDFQGGLLQRGFWIYLWRIETQDDRVLHYVGRTGDSSSPHATSPFHRMSSHFGRNRKGNALLRNLREEGVDIFESRFRLQAFGPIHPEQEDFEAHKPLRDHVATIEASVAEHLRENGLMVLGSHPRKRVPEEEVRDTVAQIVSAVQLE